MRTNNEARSKLTRRGDKEPEQIEAFRETARSTAHLNGSSSRSTSQTLPADNEKARLSAGGSQVSMVTESDALMLPGIIWRARIVEPVQCRVDLGQQALDFLTLVRSRIFGAPTAPSSD